jgi:hypothetical protein
MLQDVVALSDHATYLSNKTNFLLDATLGLINLEQNQIIFHECASDGNHGGTADVMPYRRLELARSRSVRKEG